MTVDVASLTAQYEAYLRAQNEPSGSSTARAVRIAELLAAARTARVANVDDPVLIGSLRRLYVSEAFAVSALEHTANRSETWLQISRQEQDHTILLAQALTALGEETSSPQVPPWALRQLLKYVARLPAASSAPLLTVGELIGVMILTGIHDALKVRPELAAVHHLLEEVLVDEIGHLAYNRALLSHREWKLINIVVHPLLLAAALREPYVRPHLGCRGATLWDCFPRTLRARAWWPFNVD